jgi:hypothetical protein
MTTKSTFASDAKGRRIQMTTTTRGVTCSDETQNVIHPVRYEADRSAQYHQSSVRNLIREMMAVYLTG